MTFQDCCTCFTVDRGHELSTKFLRKWPIFKRTLKASPRQVRSGVISRVLLQEGDIAGTNLAVTWVTVEPRCSQNPHMHPPEQVYVIVQGRGIMRVGDEEIPVAEGDLVHIPSNAEHSITNASDVPLAYISASTPSFDITRFYGERKI